MVAMRRSRRPKRFLFFQGGNNRIVIENIGWLLERAEPGLMREQLREADFAFSRPSKFRPEFRDSPFESDVALLQRVKQTRAPQTFRSGPEKHDRVSRPRVFAF